jgi:hypothetical protein
MAKSTGSARLSRPASSARSVPRRHQVSHWRVNTRRRSRFVTTSTPYPASEGSGFRPLCPSTTTGFAVLVQTRTPLVPEFSLSRGDDRVCRVIRPTRLAAALLLLASCSHESPAPRAAAFRPPPPLRVTAPREPLRGYRLAESFVAKGPFRDGAPLRVGAIVDGLRVRPDANGLRFAQSVSMPPLQAGVPLPEALGGGLLFWNESALYAADSFLGTLTPLLDVGFPLARVSLAPSFALLRGRDGDRLAIDPRTRQRVTLSPPLLADIAATAEGRVVALLEGGTCQLSEDAGKSYRPLALPAGTRVVSVREAAGELLVGLTSGQQIRLDVAGKILVEEAWPAARARPRADSLWPLAEPPLERALESGVLIGTEFAGVAVDGSVATVNLRTGELVQVTRALVPSELSCRALDVNGALLLSCNSKTGSLVLSDVFGERPLTQAKFASGVSLDFADGVLVASARCDGLAHPGAVCVRSVDGRLRDFDVSAQLAKLEQAAPQPKPGAKPVRTAPSIVRWVPKEGGGAVALIGGSAPGLLDAQTGSFVPVLPEVLTVVEGKHNAKAWLGLDWIAFRDGSVRGWLRNRAVAITRDGRLEPSAIEFSRLSGAGAHALALDSRQRVFQSSDWGRSWVETLAPPGSASGGKNLAPRCSQVGCLLGPWLRVGWEVEVPAAGMRPQSVAPAPPSVTREVLPTLSCIQLAAPVVVEHSRTSGSPAPQFGTSRGSLVGEEEHEALFPWATVHPTHGQGPGLGLSASLAMRVPVADPEEPRPAKWPGYSSLARISFVSAFDPNARIQTASISWRAQFDAARAAGAEPPMFQIGQMEGSALPVLGLSAGEADGLLLDEFVPLWVHRSGAIEALAARLAVSGSEWLSAVQRGPNKLALLSSGADGSLDVFEFTAGRGRRLFQMPGLEFGLYPGNADALALGVRGALAIWRTPSGREPATSADPALLFHDDGKVTMLAPWSQLFLADAPECKPAESDFRVLLQTRRAWLRLIDAGQPMNDEALRAGMFAMLRGNSERLCLEAVELADAPVDRGGEASETRVSARFVGRSRGAARLGFAAGFEFRQPLSCSLSGAR